MALEQQEANHIPVSTAKFEIPTLVMKGDE